MFCNVYVPSQLNLIFIYIIKIIDHEQLPDWSSILSGSGIGPTIQIGEETVITVDAKAAGKGKVTCKVSTPDGAELDVDVVENADGTFDIYYTAPEPGKYVITIRFGGENIPNSPFHVVVSDGTKHLRHVWLVPELFIPMIRPLQTSENVKNRRKSP